MTKFKEIKIEWVKYILLFLMAYFASVFGANFVFDFVAEKMMIHYEAIDGEKFEKLWTDIVNKRMDDVRWVPNIENRTVK